MSCTGNDVVRNGDCLFFIVDDLPPEDDTPPQNNIKIPDIGFLGPWIILFLGLAVLYSRKLI